MDTSKARLSMECDGISRKFSGKNKQTNKQKTYIRNLPIEGFQSPSPYTRVGMGRQCRGNPQGCRGLYIVASIQIERLREILTERERGRDRESVCMYVEACMYVCGERRKGYI